MNICPNCEEQMPVFSKICPVCGFVNNQSEDALSPTELANKLENNLFELKSIPEPSFLKSMGQLTFIIFPLLTLYMCILAIISEAGMFWIAAAIFAICSIIALIKKARGTLGNAKFNKQFNELKNTFEYNKRIALRDYGKSKEMTKLIGEIDGIVLSIESRRKTAAARNTIIWIIVLLAIALSGGGSAFKMNSVLNNVEEQVNQALENGSQSWEAAVESLKKMSENDPGIEEKRVEITKAILSADKTQAAEDFFFEFCIGKRMDFECASLIVKHAIDNNQGDMAKAFIEKCTSSMRYRSDVKKLNNMIQ